MSKAMSQFSATDVTNSTCTLQKAQTLTSSKEGDVTTIYALTGARNDTWGFMTDSNHTNTSYPYASEDVLWLLRVTATLDSWVPPFLFTGIFTNTLIIMVMLSKHFRHMSTSFYMVVNAILDTINLVIPLHAHYLYVNFPYIFDGIRHLHFICSICHATGRTIGNLAVALTVAMTVDRSLAIQFPLKAPTLCTVRRAKIVTVCLSVAMILMVEYNLMDILYFYLNSLFRKNAHVYMKEGHVAFTSRVVPEEIKGYLCAIDKYVSEDYRIFHDDYWPKMRYVFLMVSFVVLITGNIIIILRVKRSEYSKDIGEGSKRAGGSQSEKMSSKSRQLSIMLIIDLTSIIICTMPLSIYLMVDESFQSTRTVSNSPREKAERYMMFAVVFYLNYLNHCTNFYLYCISGSRFRQALKEVVSFTLGQKVTSISIPSTSVTRSH